jgi:Gpi18-like mannosyltransferase
LEKILTRRTVLTILLLVVISRAVILLTGYVGINLFASYTKPPAYYHKHGVSADTMKIPIQLSSTKFPNIDKYFRFDSHAYITIATQGYEAYDIHKPHPPANWVFFPLYPILLFLFGKLFALISIRDPVIVGIVLSNIFFLLSMLYIYLVCIRLGMRAKQAEAVLFLMMIYPTSLFYSLPYTESLFLLLSAASIYYALTKRYALAFLAASLSTVTRVPGVVNLLFVAGVLFLDTGFAPFKRYVRLGIYSLLSVIPLGIYLLYMKHLTGDFLAPFHEQSLHWYRYTTVPFLNYFSYFVKPYFIAPGGWDNGLLSFIVSTAVFIVYIAYLAVCWRKLYREPNRLMLYLYGVLLIVIPFSSQPWYLSSVIRYMMVCIPVFIYLVGLSVKWEKMLLTYQLLFTVLNVIVTIGFFNGYYFMA